MQLHHPFLNQHDITLDTEHQLHLGVKPWHGLDQLKMSSSHHNLRYRLAADEVLHVVRVHEVLDKGHCPDITAAVDLLFDNSQILNQPSTEPHKADTAHMLLVSIQKLGWEVMKTSGSKLFNEFVLTSSIQHVGHHLHKRPQSEVVRGLQQ